MMLAKLNLLLIFFLLRTSQAGTRLVDPSSGQPTSSNRGLLQMSINHVWKYVCDDYFDLNDHGANVACRELGYARGDHSNANLPNVFGVSDSQFYDDVRCTGSEQRLDDCPHGNGENCGRSEAVMLTCIGGNVLSNSAPTVKSRMVDYYGNPVASHVNTGLLQLWHNGVWRHVCDDIFDANSNGANVACREMGYSAGSHSNGRSSSYDFFDNVRCSGMESSLADCQFSTSHDCSRSEAITLTCRGSANTHPSTTHRPGIATEGVTSRVVSSSGVHIDSDRGILQMQVNGIWKYVCDDHFDNNNNGADIACQELGYSSGTHARTNLPSGVSSSNFYDNVACRGNEARLADCPRRMSGEDCGSSEAVFLTCSGRLDAPSSEPTVSPTLTPTQNPTQDPTGAPIQNPTQGPTAAPTEYCYFKPLPLESCSTHGLGEIVFELVSELPDCSEGDLVEGDMCEASEPLSDGNENFDINNCFGIYDIFKLTCEPIVETICDFVPMEQSLCSEVEDPDIHWDLPACHGINMYDGELCVPKQSQVTGHPNCGDRYIWQRQCFPTESNRRNLQTARLAVPEKPRRGRRLLQSGKFGRERSSPVK